MDYMVDYDDLDTPAEDYAYEDIPESSADDSDEFDEVDNVLSQPVIYLMIKKLNNYDTIFEHLGLLSKQL